MRMAAAAVLSRRRRYARPADRASLLASRSPCLLDGGCSHASTRLDLALKCRRHPRAWPARRSTRDCRCSPTNIVGRLFADAAAVIPQPAHPGAAGASAGRTGSRSPADRQRGWQDDPPGLFLCDGAARLRKRRVTTSGHVAEIYGFATRLTIIVGDSGGLRHRGSGRALLALFGTRPDRLFRAARYSLHPPVRCRRGQASAVQTVISRYHHPLVGRRLACGCRWASARLLLPEAQWMPGARGSAGIDVVMLTPMIQLWVTPAPSFAPLRPRRSWWRRCRAAIAARHRDARPLHHLIRIALARGFC